jgi:hypothetical protein
MFIAHHSSTSQINMDSAFVVPPKPVIPRELASSFPHSAAEPLRRRGVDSRE